MGCPRHGPGPGTCRLGCATPFRSHRACQVWPSSSPRPFYLPANASAPTFKREWLTQIQSLSTVSSFPSSRTLSCARRPFTTPLCCVASKEGHRSTAMLSCLPLGTCLAGNRGLSMDKELGEPTESCDALQCRRDPNSPQARGCRIELSAFVSRQIRPFRVRLHVLKPQFITRHALPAADSLTRQPRHCVTHQVSKQSVSWLPRLDPDKL